MVNRYGFICTERKKNTTIGAVSPLLTRVKQLFILYHIGLNVINVNLIVTDLCVVSWEMWLMAAQDVPGLLDLNLSWKF